MTEGSLLVEAVRVVSAFEGLNVVLGPAVSMLLGSAFALYLRVPDRIQACTQNFSAGFLISAVAAELYPLLSPEGVDDVTCTLGLGVGFIVGLIFMFGLEHLMESEEDEEEKQGRPASNTVDSDLEQPLLSDEESGTAVATFRGTTDTLKEDVTKISASIEEGYRNTIDHAVHDAMLHVHQAERQLTLTGPLSDRDIERLKFHCEELKVQSEELGCTGSIADGRRALKVFSATLDHIHEHAERKPFKRWNPAPMSTQMSEVSEKLPLPLIASVAADGAVDGLLIGLAFAASPGAGWAMSIATCIEMGFLGLSFCATISNATRSIMTKLLVISTPPFLLLLAGVLGTHVGDALHKNPAIFVCFIGFSIVCLLFLVTQELLAEAREIAGDNAVINIMFFVGLFGGILLEKFVG